MFLFQFLLILFATNVNKVASRNIHCTAYVIFEPSCHMEHLDLIDVAYDEEFNVFVEPDFFFGTTNLTRENITVLRLYDPFIEYIPYQLLTAFPSVDSIHIDRTHVGVLSTVFFQTHNNYEKMTTFGCSYCQISSIDDAAFSQFKNLESLYLDYNEIIVLSYKMFSYSPKLKTIDLSHNKINFIENYETFARYHRLDSLNLKSNKCVSRFYGKKTIMLMNISRDIQECVKNWKIYEKLGMDMNYEETEVEKLHKIVQEQQLVMISTIHSSIVWAAVWTIFFIIIIIAVAAFIITYFKFPNTRSLLSSLSD